MNSIIAIVFISTFLFFSYLTFINCEFQHPDHADHYADIKNTAKARAVKGLEKSYEMYLNFLYYPGESANETLMIDVDSIELLPNQPNFNPEKKTVIYCAGHNENFDDSLTVFIINQYLYSQNYNVVQLNWSRFAKEFYLNSIMDLERIGAFISSKLDYLFEATEIDIELVELTGHSLGAQLVGVIGRNSKFQYPYIMGLDPAAPGFYFFEDHLSQIDARFVAAIHSDGGFYGTTLNDVHLNFYANTGTRYQPGCSINPSDTCSHQRSVYIWGYALTDDDLFQARQCENYFKFSTGLCNGAITANINPNIRNVTGKFFFKTDDRPPYGLGVEGV